LLAVASRAAEWSERAAELSPAVASMAAQAQAVSVSAAVVFQDVETAAASAQKH
jgi:hypothetical protein